MTTDRRLPVAALTPIPDRTLVRVGATCTIVAGALRLATSFVDPDVEGGVISAVYDVIDIGLLFAAITAFVAIPESRTRLGTLGFAIAAIGAGLLIGPAPSEDSVDHYALGATVVTLGFAALAIAWHRSELVTPATRAAFLATLVVGAASGLHPVVFVVAGLAFALGLLQLGRCLLTASAHPGAPADTAHHRFRSRRSPWSSSP